MQTIIKINPRPKERPLSENERQALADFEQYVNVTRSTEVPGQHPSKGHYESGMIYLRAGQLAEAQREFQTATESPGKDIKVKAYAQLLNLHVWKEDTDAAFGDLEKIMEIEPTTKGSCNHIKADILRRDRQHEKAVVFYDRAIAAYDR